MKVYRNNKSKENIIRTYNLLLNEWSVPVTEVDIPTKYGITHVNTFGNPNYEPLLLFHGVGDDSALMWIYNAKTLAEHFSIYAVDTIGGPGKSIPNKNYNKEFDDVAWIDEILDYLHLKEVNLAGTSHGGYLVQLYTLKRPERIKKAVALASSVPENTGKSPMKTMMQIFLPEALFPTKKNVFKLLKKLSGKNSNVFTDNKLLLQHYTYLLKGFINMAMRYHKVSAFSNEEIESIKEKCLYLVGKADPFAIRGGKAAIEKHSMNAIFYPEIGHGINHEISYEINSAIINYFQKS